MIASLSTVPTSTPGRYRYISLSTMQTGSEPLNCPSVVELFEKHAALVQTWAKRQFCRSALISTDEPQNGHFRRSRTSSRRLLFSSYRRISSSESELGVF